MHRPSAIAYATVGTLRYLDIRDETEQRLDRALRIAQEHTLKALETNETVLARIMDAAGDDPARALKAGSRR